MKSFKEDLYQYLLKKNKMELRYAFPLFPEPLKIGEITKTLQSFSNTFAGVNANYPFEVEITIPWSKYVQVMSLPDDKTPTDWVNSKLGQQVLHSLVSILDSKKTIRNNNWKKNSYTFPLALFAGIGFAWNHSYAPSGGSDFPPDLKIFFLFSQKSHAEKYVKELKSTKGFKALGMKTKIRDFDYANISPGKKRNKKYKEMDLKEDYLFWWRRALSDLPGIHMYGWARTTKKLGKQPFPFFAPLNEFERIRTNKEEILGQDKKSSRQRPPTWPTSKTTKSGTKMPTKKSKSTHKKLSVTKVKSEAKKYAKSRSKKKWPTLAKKFGMKQAQRIVKAAKKLEPKKKSVKRGSRKTLKPVPQHMKAVSGNRTPPFAIPQQKKFPIGTLAYAKKAIDYLTWDAAPQVRNRNAYYVMNAVKNDTHNTIGQVIGTNFEKPSRMPRNLSPGLNTPKGKNDRSNRYRKRNTCD